MRDECEARLLRQHREDMNRAIDSFAARLMQSFRVLHRIQWSAPWQHETSCRP